ncbi:hypothetical protein DFH28DRAFT_1124168 [Melampsora americana]|nr:hypothetical protein DFH28DRAFT_1124168 [Melampsora americana]
MYESVISDKSTDESDYSETLNRSNKSNCELNESDESSQSGEEGDEFDDLITIDKMSKCLLSSLCASDGSEVGDDIGSLDESSYCDMSSSNSEIPDLENLFTSDQKTDWYPFKEKEHLVSMLLIGSSQNLMSREEHKPI